MKDPISVHDQFARDYDRQIREYHCFAADVLFGLSFEYMHPRERLLDLGIGTGLSAWPFAQLGLHVSGCDSSAAMLDLCRSKNVAVELEQFDLQNTPWPYASGSFDHAISCGVLHFINDLRAVFDEVTRVIQINGVFAFTTKVPPASSRGTIGVTSEGVNVFMHSRPYIDQCLRTSGFKVLKDVKFYVGSDDARAAELFSAFVVQKPS